MSKRNQTIESGGFAAGAAYPLSLSSSDSSSPSYPNLNSLSLTESDEEILTQVQNILLSQAPLQQEFIHKLKELEERYYKPQFKKITNPQTAEERQKLSEIFEAIGDVRTIIAKFNNTRTVELKYYTDAALFYVYVINLIKNGHDNISKQTKLYQKLSNIENNIISKITGISCNINDTEQRITIYQDRLTQLRQGIQDTLKDSEHDHELEQNELAQNIFTYTTSSIRGILRDLFIESQNQLAMPPLEYTIPCKYSVIGLGSMSMNQMTPFSDLEFAIITEKSRNTPGVHEYFKNLTHLVHFKIIALGETLITELPYSAVNDLMHRGVTFDLGGKTPLGIPGKDYTLIGTKDELMTYVQDEDNAIEKIDNILPYILEKVVHIYGEYQLTQEYTESCTKFIKQNALHRAKKVFTARVAEEINSNDILTQIYGSGDLNNCRLGKMEFFGTYIDAKREIYRVSDRLIYNFGMLYGIIGDECQDNWSIIDKLRERNIISENAAANLQFIATFSTNLRLKTYLYYKGKKDNIAITPMTTQQSAIYHLSKEELTDEDKSALYKYFRIVHELQGKLKRYFDQPLLEINLDFFTNTDFLSSNTQISDSLVHLRLLNYDKKDIQGVLLRSTQQLQNLLEKGLSIPSNVAEKLIKPFQMKTSDGLVTKYYDLKKSNENTWNAMANTAAYMSIMTIYTMQQQKHDNIIPLFASPFIHKIELIIDKIEQRTDIKRYHELIVLLRGYFEKLQCAKNFNSLIKYIIQNIGKSNISALDARSSIFDQEMIDESLTPDTIVPLERYQSELEQKNYFTNKNLYIINTLMNLGRAYYLQKNYIKAEQYLKQCLEKIVEIDPCEPIYARLLCKLGDLYEAQQKYKEATEYYYASIMIAKYLYDKERESCATFNDAIEKIQKIDTNHAKLKLQEASNVANYLTSQYDLTTLLDTIHFLITSEFNKTHSNIIEINSLQVNKCALICYCSFYLHLNDRIIYNNDTGNYTITLNKDAISILYPQSYDSSNGNISDAVLDANNENQHQKSPSSILNLNSHMAHDIIKKLSAEGKTKDEIAKALYLQQLDPKYDKQLFSMFFDQALKIVHQKEQDSLFIAQILDSSIFNCNTTGNEMSDIMLLKAKTCVIGTIEEYLD